MPNVLVTGGSGQLAKAIKRAAARGRNTYSFPNHTELDICDSAAVMSYIRQHDIDVVVNCAAYTNVDGAEDNRNMAQAINCDAAVAIAKICKQLNIALIHISTDYVFGGNEIRRTPYSETDPIAPINIYGDTKAQGEKGVIEHGGIVIRTSWLYAPWGKNFVRTILRLATKQEELSVVNDQHGSPTSAIGLAKAIVAIIDNGEIEQMTGIYHYADIGVCSWYDFACEIIDLAEIKSCKVAPCKTSERQMRAARPTYSALDTQRISAIKGVELMSRTERLKEVMTLMENDYE